MMYEVEKVSWSDKCEGFSICSKGFIEGGNRFMYFDNGLYKDIRRGQIAFFHTTRKYF